MEQPPQDSAGRVKPHDHQQIHDDDIMLRGIPQIQIFTKNGEKRVSSAAFNKSSPEHDKYCGLSLSAKKILDCINQDIEQWAAERFAAVASFPAEEFRKTGAKIGWDPTEGDRSHCNAWGDFTKSTRKNLARQATQQLKTKTS